MKKTLSILILLFFTLILQAQVSKTVDILAGGLDSALTANEKSTVINLTITGTIDARDFKTMRDEMSLLVNLDLSGAPIVEYLGTEGTSYTDNYTANTVPQYAFYKTGAAVGMTNLKSVVFSPSVVAIDMYAFANCNGLNDIYTLLSSVQTIGPNAFRGCSGLTSLSFPSTVKSIGNLAFGNCTGITSVTIPSSVTFIDFGAIGGCKGPINVDEGNPNYSSKDGVLFNKTKTILIQCPISMEGTYTIPSSVTTIYDNAFLFCTLLTSVIIPESVVSIGLYSFAYSGLIGTLTLPQSLTKIEVSAFQNCSGLTGSLIITSSVTSIGFRAFESCSGITSVTIPSSVSNIDDYAFSGCIGIKTIVINQNSPFNLSSSANVFQEVDKTKCELQVPYGTKNLYSSSIGWKDFENIKEKPSGFLVSNDLVNLELEQGSNATLLISANISWNIISDQAWLNVEPANGNGNKEITITATEANQSVSPRIANLTVSSIGYSSQSITVIQKGSNESMKVTPGNLSSVLSKSNIDSVRSLKLTGNMDSRDFAFIRDSMPMLNDLDLNDVTVVAFSGLGGTLSSYYNYPENELPLNSFSNGSFPNESKLKNVILPSSIISIGADAFYRCGKLIKIDFPASLTNIANGAFFTCIGLTSISFPTSVVSIGKAAFNYCENLKSIQTNSAIPIELNEDTSPFNGINKSVVVLYVPAGTKNIYQNATVWKDFFNIVEDEMTLENGTMKRGNDKVILFPNPVTESFRISGLEGRAVLTVSDLSGKLMFSKEIEGNEYIPVNLLAKGMYIVRVTSEEGRIERKLLKE
jgi:hypothetical protein